MSEKKAKQDRKMKLITGEAKPVKAAIEIAKSIRKMYEDRDAKALAAKERLVFQLSVTADKYRTGNGVMSALETIRMVLGDRIDELTLEEEVSYAKGLAIVMADKTTRMADKAKELDPEGMDKLCEGFYSADFADSEASLLDLTEELMTLQLCQNVGPGAEDVVSFLENADKEIEKARENLRTYCKEKDLDFDEICGEKGDNLCEMCGNSSCHESDEKFIKVGQSAYDVCKEFVE